MKNLINDINISKLKEMNISQKEQLASEIRQFLIDNISQTGGHLSSNLGVVELTIAIYSVIDAPKDLIIFDVGHQVYTHKILTGRKDDFSTLRKKGGLSGFINTKESEFDKWEGGHSSTSISASIAYALTHPNSTVVAFIGDSSFVNGVSLEAINHLGELNLNNLIVILNDNDMSISDSVGGLKKTLNKLSLKSTKINQETISTLSHFNVNYLGPYNGHDIKSIESIISNVVKVNSDKSTLIHFKTIKGKGYLSSELDNVGLWHGVGQFSPKHGEFIKKASSGISWSQVVSNQIESLMENDNDIYVTTPAMEIGSKLTNIKNKFPNRFFDVGISEEHAVVFNSALNELGNKKPFLSIYSTFLQRSYDFLLTDTARKNNHLVLGIDRCGLIGEDGPTHQGVWDVSFLNTLPNTTIMQPKDSIQCYEMLKYAFNQSEGIYAIRYPRDNCKNYIGDNNTPKSINWEVIFDLKDVNIISYGRQLSYLEMLENDCFGLINACVVNKLDKQILSMLKTTKKLYVIEEVIENNSLYEMIIKYAYKNNFNIEIIPINVSNPFIEQAHFNQQLDECNLSFSKLKDLVTTFEKK